MERVNIKDEQVTLTRLIKLYIKINKVTLTWIASPRRKNFAIIDGTVQFIYRLWTIFCTMGSTGTRDCTNTPLPNTVSQFTYAMPGPI